MRRGHGGERPRRRSVVGGHLGARAGPDDAVRDDGAEEGDHRNGGRYPGASSRYQRGRAVVPLYSTGRQDGCPPGEGKMISPDGPVLEVFGRVVESGLLEEPDDVLLPAQAGGAVGTAGKVALDRQSWSPGRARPSR